MPVRIARDQQSHVFQEVRRMKDRNSFGAGGTGTGPLIWWMIAEELDGQITLSSEADQSPTFPVELPRGQAEC